MLLPNSVFRLELRLLAPLKPLLAEPRLELRFEVPSTISEFRCDPRLEPLDGVFLYRFSCTFMVERL